MTLLWMVSRGACTATRSQAYVTAMKSDLRNLAHAQDEFHAMHGRYASSLMELSTRVTYLGSTFVVTTIVRADEGSWSANAINHQLPRWSCTSHQGLDNPRCVQQTTWAERNIPRPTFGTTVLEYWLVWLTLLRRQRRAAIAKTSQESGRAA